MPLVFQYSIPTILLKKYWSIPKVFLFGAKVVEPLWEACVALLIALTGGSMIYEVWNVYIYFLQWSEREEELRVIVWKLGTWPDIFAATLELKVQLSTYDMSKDIILQSTKAHRAGLRWARGQWGFEILAKKLKNCAVLMIYVQLASFWWLTKHGPIWEDRAVELLNG